MTGGAGEPRLAVLLPVRDAEGDLPGWFESVTPLRAAVIALDDGSTDATAERLEAGGADVVLRNPPREGFVRVEACARHGVSNPPRARR